MNKLLYIDLFCGAGGTSTGVERARFDGDGEPFDPKDLAKTLFRAVSETHYDITEVTSTLKTIIEK